MVRGRVGVLVSWCLLLSGGLWQYTAAQRDTVHTYNYLPFLADQPREPPEDSRNDQPSITEGMTVEGRDKRVFLSRGWGPGGYEAPRPPPSPPHRFARRPPSWPEQRTSGQKLQPSKMGTGLGGARFAALVSMARQRSSPSQPKASQRRFHSIFTSGTWRPLGKRSPNSYPPQLPVYEATDEYHDDNQRLLPGLLNDEDRTKLGSLDEDSSWTGYQAKSGLQNMEQSLSGQQTKRSGVFSSYGWGAGGSVTSPQNLWSSHSSAINWKPTFNPITTGLTRWNGENNENTNVTPGDRNIASFREGAPLFHLFLSRGWGPMGR